MENVKYPGKGLKILSVILGTLVGGFMWRCRGETGFGSSWGLYSVGLMLILLIFHLYSDRKGMQYEKIPLGALLTGVGVTGYATVLDQMGGTITSDLPYQGEVVNMPINPSSGVIMMIITAFTLVPFFAFFVGSLFSKKEYKFHHYIIMIALFFVVSLICKATVSHYILKAINPEQIHYAELGLVDKGYDYSSAMQAYMKNFGDRDWTQEIPFFENYYMSIEAISDSFGIIAICLYALIAFKDAVTAIVTFIINLFTAIASTFATVLLYAGYETGIFNKIVPARWFGHGQWGLWEFATGASVGFITMLVLALLPKKLTAAKEPDMSPLFKNDKVNFAFNVLLTCFIFAVVPCRVIGIRFGKLLKYEGIMETSTVGDIVMIAGSVIVSVLLILFLVKNMLKNNSTAMNKTPLEFSRVAFPAYLALCAFAYFCLNHGYIFHLPYAQMTSFKNAIYVLTGAECIEFTVMIVTLILIVLFYLPVHKKAKQK